MDKEFETWMNIMERICHCHLLVTNLSKQIDEMKDTMKERGLWKE